MLMYIILLGGGIFSILVMTIVKKGFSAGVNRQQQPIDSNALYFLKGVGGCLEVHNDAVLLTPTGVLGAMTKGFGTGTKRIPFSSITATQFKEASPALNGFLQLSILGSHEARGGLLRATKDENTFLFGNHLNAKVKEVNVFIEEKIRTQLQGRGSGSTVGNNEFKHNQYKDDGLDDFLQDDRSSQMWIMRPDGKIGGPFTRKKLDELKSLGKLPSGLKASHSKEGPWKLFPTS
jgi:hypothetical protein